MLTEAAIKTVFETARFILQLKRKGVIQGKVYGQDGTPAANATVSINGYLWQISSCRTSLSGSFVFSDLREGIYRLDVTHGSYDFQNMEQVHLSAGRELHVEIHLPVTGGNAQQNPVLTTLDDSHALLDVVIDGRIAQTSTRDSRRILYPPTGKDYSIVLSNRWSAELLAVLTVDGLSVMNGEPGGFSSGGYVIAPFKSVQVPGWRLNDNEVAKFVFQTEDRAYATLKNMPDNIGVIACAFFERKPRKPPEVKRIEPMPLPERLESRVSPLGTEFGSKQEHSVTRVEFERREAPSVIKTIYYVADAAQAKDPRFEPNPFPGCVPPPGWQGEKG